LCPFCGTPVPGTRKSNQSMEEATQNLPLFDETEKPSEQLTNLAQENSE
jgi:hypothetical protein